MNHSEFEVVVRFRDLDALGHVNYAVYLSYLEDALNHLWGNAIAAIERGFDPRELGIVTVRTEIDYKDSALYNQTLVVKVWVSAIGNSSFTTVYRILEKQNGKLLAQAKTVQVVTIPGEDKGMPSKIRSVLQSYLALEH